MDKLLAELVRDVYSSASYQKYAISGVEYQLRYHSLDDTVVIPVQGSKGKRDWFNNIRVLPVYSPTFGLVHAGFYWHARRAAEQILSDTQLSRSERRKVIVVGHSKGGAEALIIAGILKKAGINVSSVVTFGAPQFITAYGARKLRDSFPVRQYRCDRDLVTQLPSSRFDFYRHVMPLIRITSDGVFDDHDIRSYINALPADGPGTGRIK